MIDELEQARKKIRGLRNNNPGNVREPKGDRTVWVGERATDDDPAFEEFDHMWQGVRAARIVFQNYQRKYGLSTISALIRRWAPPEENDTDAYVRSVSKACGFGPFDLIMTTDMVFMSKFLRAVFRHENGPLADDLVTDNDMHLGLLAA